MALRDFLRALITTINVLNDIANKGEYDYNEGILVVLLFFLSFD